MKHVIAFIQDHKLTQVTHALALKFGCSCPSTSIVPMSHSPLLRPLVSASPKVRVK